MNKFILFLFSLLFVNAFAQSGFYGRVGLGFSYLPTLNYSNLENTNNILRINNFPGIQKNYFYNHTIAGYFYSLFIPDVRIGGYYSFGNITSTNQSSEKYTSTFSNAFGGVSIEYTFSLSSINISLGSIIGGGKETLKLSKTTTPLFINNLFEKNNIIEINQNFFSVIPTLNVEYSLNRFLALRIGCGYNIKLTSKPEIEDSEINNFSQDLSINNFFLTGGLIIGFFSR